MNDLNMAGRSQYKFCPEQLTYIKIEKNIRTRFKQGLPYILIASVIAIIIYFFTASLHKTPRELMLMTENFRLKSSVDYVNKQLKVFDMKLNSLEQQDDSLYRSILGIEPIPVGFRKSGTGGSAHDMMSPSNNMAVVTSSYNKIESLFSRLKVQKKSYELLFVKAKLNNERLIRTPAIIPIANHDLSRIGSGFGQRFHPILGFTRPHKGLDFHASTGTPVYASADGTIIKAEYSSTFGNVVQVNHGFGVSTLYAHLHKIYAKVGQKIKRGEELGEVGNTGLSVGPHLHYEVLLNGVEVNPVNYFFNDLTPAEYEKVVETAEQQTTSMD
jgi:murein DD-endopeptidase MepM/ murein hydrolase activator NlpD